MRITYKGDYALKTILDLALHYSNSPVTIHDLAKRLDIPLKFLEQILLDLKRAGFVESRRGKVGGYLLARPPKQIKLAEIIRFIDGPLEPISCVADGYKGCQETDRCVFRNIWKKIGQLNSEILEAITFEDLARKTKKANPAFIYQI